MKVEVMKGEMLHPFLKEQGGHVVYVSSKGRALDSRNGNWKNLHDNGNGYYFFLQGTTSEGKSIREYIHRAVATCFLDNPDNLPQVNHINLDKTDNSIENLEWTSGSRNIRHAHESGAMIKRTSNGQINILTEEQVIDLYTSVLAGMEFLKRQGRWVFHEQRLVVLSTSVAEPTLPTCWMRNGMVTKRKRKPPSLRKPSPRDLAYMQLLRQGGAIFDGCSTPQEKLERVRELIGVGRPSAFMRSLLKPITQEVFDTVALACTNAIIQRAEAHRSDRASILVKLPLTFRRYNKTFPKGILVDVLDIGTALFRYNANTLLDYLHKKGKVAYNSRMLRKSLGDVKRLLNNVDKQLDIDDIAGYDALTDEEMDMFLLKYGANGELVNVANKLVVRKLERLEKARIKREEKKDTQ